tara:strand:+ start:295 stop:444 length:150 start_codon:yes stop_codon:yes gene_type:complete
MHETLKLCGKYKEYHQQSEQEDGQRNASIAEFRTQKNAPSEEVEPLADF